MERRSFIKLGMFACLPVVPDFEIRQGISMELLSKFTEPNVHYRYDCSKPFVEHGNASATDGKAGIRVFDTMGIADPDKPVELPPLAEAIDRFMKPGLTWRDWPKADYQPADHGCCWFCNGRGYFGELRDCSNCHGTGEIPYPMNADEWDDYVLTCPKCCDGKLSDRMCPECKGEPWESQEKAKQPLDDRFIASGYHHLISQLPDVRYATPETGVWPEPRAGIVLIQFEGGNGALMPLVTE